MAECKTSHSLIWNWKGYGTNIRGELRRNDTPRTIYLSNSASAVHSFAFDIDVDITGNTGIGIESEGANGNIAGIIESCQGGGYFYNGVHISSGVNINVHFEENEQFDAKIGVPEYVVDGSRNAGVTNIIGSFALFKGEGNNLLFGSGQQINVIGSMGFKAGAIDDTVNKATTVITEIGNFASAGLLSEEDKEIVGYVGILRRRAYLEELNVNSGDLQSKDRLRLRPFNKTALTVTDKEVLPPHLGIELGGEFNRFSTIYGRYINLISPDGSEFRIQVDDEGNLSAIRL